MIPRGRRSAGQRGRAAELSARAYLEERGLHFVEGNYRCKRGEIDAVMRDGATLVFVEIRYRRDGRYGSAAESVDARKRARLLVAAAHYLQSRDLAPDISCRFDVVALTGPPSQARIEWICDAFRA